MPALIWADPAIVCPGGTGALSGCVCVGSPGLWKALFLILFIYLFGLWVLFMGLLECYCWGWWLPGKGDQGVAAQNLPPNTRLVGSPANPEERDRLEASQEVDKPLLGGNHPRPTVCPPPCMGAPLAWLAPGRPPL